MSELENGLKEIEQCRKKAAENGDFNVAAAYEKSVDIIRNHMNDDWIPVNLRLPEEKGVYLVTYHPCYWDNVEAEVRVGIDTFRGKTAWAQRKYQRVIAWRPLPEPYFPERSDNHDGE